MSAEKDLSQPRATYFLRHPEVLSRSDSLEDGEFWKARNFAYYSRHLTGLETRALRPGETGSTRTFTRERDEFKGFYRDLDATGTIFHVPGEQPMPPERERTIATGPV